MLKVLNQNKQVLHLLRSLKDFYIESDLATADKLLSFRLAKSEASAKDIIQEGYLRTATDEFVIKEVNKSDANYIQVFAKLNLEDLKKKAITSFDATEKTAREIVDGLLSTSIAGWTAQYNDVPVSKRRTIRKDEVTTAYDLIIDVCKTFNIEVEIDTLNKVLKFAQAIGANRGSYVYSELNLKKTEMQSDTYDFKTRLYAYGKDGLTFSSINAGKEYIDNNQHSTKIIEMVWKDDRYTNAQNLLEDAIIKLNDLSKPRVSYVIDVLSLANKPEYNAISFKLGDSIKVLDKENGIIDTQRIVKLVEYPLTPEKNKATLSNTQLIFTDTTDEIREAVSNANSEVIKTRTDLMKAIEESSNLITGANGGYIVIRYNVDNKPYELLIMDTDSVTTAQNVWRWNVNGLGFSSTGYNGSYSTAITANGKINASFITVGELNASLLKAGLIQSRDGSSFWNLETGEIVLNVTSLTINASGEARPVATMEDVAGSVSDRASNEDINALANIINGLATEVQAKASDGELQDLTEAYNTRVQQEIADKQAVSNSLATLEGRVNTVNTILGDKTAKWEFIETSVTMADEGIFIGNEAKQMGVLIAEDRISFMDKGVEVAYISNKTMEITHGIFVKSAIIGKHKIETIPNTNITVFTFVG